MLLKNILSLNWIATIAINYRIGGMRCVVRMPVKVYGKLRWHIGGNIILPHNAVRGTLIIGSEHEDYTVDAGRAEFYVDGMLKIEGMVSIGHDCFIAVKKGAMLSMGDRTFIGRDSQIHCSNEIKIGDDVFCGETYVTDCTEHQIIHDGKKREMFGKVVVGDGVYMGFRTMLLKDTVIPPHSIVASGSVCRKDYSIDAEGKIMLAGVPAKVKVCNIEALK